MAQQLEAITFTTLGPLLPGATSASAAWAPPAATQAVATPAGGGEVCVGGPLLWPIDPNAVTATVPFVEGSHPGLELAAPPGTPVYAANSGSMQSSLMDDET